MVQLVGIPIPALVLSVIFIQWNTPIFQTWGVSNLAIIFGGITLFAVMLLIYSTDFLLDIRFWEHKSVGHFKVLKLLAKIWMSIGISILLGLMLYLVVSEQTKVLLAGEKILGFLNLQVAVVVVLTGVYGILKLSKWRISGLYFIFLIALVSALSITIPIYLLSNQSNFRYVSDLFQPMVGFFGLFLMNLITVSFFEKEKDMEGNTLNIWNTNPSIALFLVYLIPTITMIAYWTFKWNATMHAQFFVMFLYLIMYFFPKIFRIISIYRILADVALLLIFLKIKW